MKKYFLKSTMVLIIISLCIISIKLIYDFTTSLRVKITEKKVQVQQESERTWSNITDQFTIVDTSQFTIIDTNEFIIVDTSQFIIVDTDSINQPKEVEVFQSEDANDD